MSLWKLLTAAYDSSGNSAKVRIDKATSSLQTIDYAHHEVHGGSTFMYAQAPDLAINNVRDIQITTPNTTKWAHLTVEVATESETDVYFYENVTINTAGTADTIRNMNRNSATTTTLTIKRIDNTSLANANADTAVAGANTLWRQIIGAGKNSGSFNHDTEMVLKQNEDYCLRFIANAAGYVNYFLRWYEHTDHN